LIENDAIGAYLYGVTGMTFLTCHFEDNATNHIEIADDDTTEYTTTIQFIGCRLTASTGEESISPIHAGDLF